MKSSRVIALMIGISVVAVALLTMTMLVLYDAGCWWLACAIFAPLAYGLARWPIWVSAVFRPEWFKPGWLEQNGFRRKC